VLVLFADTPLVTGASVGLLRAALAGGAGVAVLGFIAENPYGYGRLLQDDAGKLFSMRKKKHASVEEAKRLNCATRA
jgi:bifunctional UDP-N-acetylglucosamine pyrophosphorylase/glucosamine-1-phosphate N-acetyltransferase